MSPNIVIVDDHDQNIRYGGPGWAPGGLPVEFRSTTMVSRSTGSTVTYTFNGTALSVWGTVLHNSSSSASYAIDGGPPVEVFANPDQDQYWKNLFSWTSLQDGTHTITINTRTGVFSLDFLLLTPSPGTSLDGATLMVDDNDPSIEWEPSTQWSALGTFPEFQNTTHDTAAAASIMRYKFSGSAISVWGTIQPDIPSTAYSIDGGMPFTWNTPATSEKIFHQQFYASPSLTAGDHTLVITVGNNSGAVIIDYLLVEVSASAGSTTTVNLPLGTSQPPSDTASSNTRTPTAAIAGGAVGGAILFAALAAILFYLFRRRRRHQSDRRYFDDDRQNYTDEVPVVITPFVPPQAGGVVSGGSKSQAQGRFTAPSSTGTTAEMDYLGSSSVALTHSVQPLGTSYTSESTSQVSLSQESAAPPLLVTGPQMASERLPYKRQQSDAESSAPSPPSPRIHTDGGVRLAMGHASGQNEIPPELPPVYGNYGT